MKFAKKLLGFLCRLISLRPIDVITDYFYIRALRPQMMVLNWEPIEDGSIERVESACVQIRDKMYLFAGYHTLDHVISAIDVLDLKTGQWVDHIPMPEGIATTHQGVICERDRFIYHVAGQVSIQCSPCVADCYVFDVTKKTWQPLPSLPQPRYAPIVRLWNGRLHALGGSTEDRVTPACEHWSLSVKEGEALEQYWRKEPPIPRGGPHRCSAVIGNKLYVLGGQEGDRPPIPGDPNCTCDWSSPDEIFYGHSYVLTKGDSQWQRISDMPVKVTHAEYSTFMLGASIVILGGLMDQKMLSDVIQVYETTTDEWKIIGRLPWRNKGLVAAYYDGWLYALTGQKAVSLFNPSFGKILKGGYRTKFDLMDQKTFA